MHVKNRSVIASQFFPDGFSESGLRSGERERERERERCLPLVECVDLDTSEVEPDVPTVSVGYPPFFFTH